ncbi:hypothetical protein [Jeotgalibacillus campisalis]|uniref:Uncharacterized protein n=1 Tax=Jeotgalibacillus campisalis TaxID=220754 RepID=A0A0C2RLK2_9BACL|nr:hypothetical protein [Jeotgalibacillus campisalis]KIL51120.1 hypothetical protein KR50_10010 [Jeotgalibacillus campisalis]
MQNETTSEYSAQYNHKEMTTKSWVGTILLLMIPLVNLVLLFVWGFGSENSQRKNYSRATLIVMGIVLAVYLVIFVIFFILAGMAGGFSTSP